LSAFVRDLRICFKVHRLFISRPPLHRLLAVSSTIGGWADTAGVRASADAIEQEGVRRAKAQAAQADVVVAVVDGRQLVGKTGVLPRIFRWVSFIM
jgi:hypothetical protein